MQSRSISSASPCLEPMEGTSLSRTFRMGEFFSGPGGMALGARWAAENVDVDLTHAWANDIDDDTCRTYRTYFGLAEQQVICDDVRHVDVDALPDIDGFAFGFPCNDFSTVGESRGLDGRYGPLYTNGVAVLKAKQPRWFVAENVSGLRSSNEGRALPQIMGHLADAGYRLTPHLYKFEEYGVPQKRHRIIIVGIHEDENLTFNVPAPTTRHVPENVAQALAHITPGTPNHEMPKHSQTVIDRLKAIPAGKNAFNAGLEHHEDPRIALKVKGATLSNIYRRLEADKPSYTVTGSGGGGTHIYHWSEPRALTNRERARLQTFPDDFTFLGGVSSARKQIGMAVPPRGAEIIFEALFKTFQGRTYDHVAQNLEWNPEELTLPEFELA